MATKPPPLPVYDPYVTHDDLASAMTGMSDRVNLKIDNTAGGLSRQIEAMARDMRDRMTERATPWGVILSILVGAIGIVASMVTAIGIGLVTALVLYGNMQRDQLDLKFTEYNRGQVEERKEMNSQYRSEKERNENNRDDELRDYKRRYHDGLEKKIEEGKSNGK